MNLFSKLLLMRRLRRQMYRLDADQLRQLQIRLRRQVIDHAVAHSPFFKELYAGHDLDDFTSLPMVDKATMMNHFDDYTTVGLSRQELLAFAQASETRAGDGLYQDRWSVGLSSGTSGNKGLTVLSPDERDRYGCLIAARHGLPKHIKRFRVLFALRINNPSFQQLNSFGLHLVYTDYNHSPDELVDLINRQRLNVLAGPPSFLRLLASARDRLDRPVQALVCYAEVLDPETRIFLQQAFDAPVVEIYQGSEGFVAATCRQGRLHLMEDVVLVEVVPMGPGEPGRVVLTDLHRRTQPIVRYQLNDVLEVGQADCSCGSAFRTVTRIHGRADDVFIFDNPDGQRRHLFSDYVRRAIVLASDAIVEYQAIQHSADRVELRLVLEPNADAATIREAVKKNLQGRLQDAGVDPRVWPRVEFSDQAIEKHPVSGKLIRVQRRFET